MLIYCNPDAQTAILTRFHFALKSTGFLLLGKSENLIHHRQIFTSVSTKQRVYSKGLSLKLEDYLYINSQLPKKQLAENVTIQALAWQTSFENSSMA